MSNEKVHVIELRGASKDCDKTHIAPEKPKKRITTTGEVSIDILPTTASVKIPLKGEGKTAKEANSHFKEVTQKVIQTIGDATQFSFSSPETCEIETTEKGYRNSQTTIVYSTGTINLSAENLGSVLSDLLENDIPFHAPEFTFDQTSQMHLSVYEEATSRAKQKAETIVTAAGCALGKVHDILYSDGSEQEKTFSERNINSFLSDKSKNFQFFENKVMHQSLNTFHMALEKKMNLFKREEEEVIDWDPRLLNLLQTQIPSQVQKVWVSVTYEIEV